MNKSNRKNFIFEHQQNAELIKRPGEIAGNAFLCRNLTNCSVYLCDRIGTVYIDDCTNCRFYLGPVSASVFMRSCHDCQLSVAAQQVRISDSTHTTAFLFSQTETTLENVTGLVIGPFNFSYPGIEDHFSQQALNLGRNLAFKVTDFTPCPLSWRIMLVEEYPGPVSQTLGMEAPLSVNPVPLPVYYGGSIDVDVFNMKQGSEEDCTQDADGMMSFKINVSMAEAEKRASVQQKSASNSDNIDSPKTELIDGSQK